MKDRIIELLPKGIGNEYVLIRISFTLFASVFSLCKIKNIDFLRMFSHSYGYVKTSYF